MKDLNFSKSVRLLAESKMRNQAIKALSRWDGASTCVFGGSIRRTILSENSIQEDQELLDRLDQDSYQEYNLSPDHFLPLGTDLDVYITNPRNVDTCLQDLTVHMEQAMKGYGLVLRVPNERYACTRMWIRTHHHPIAPVIQIQLDLVMEGVRCFFPDFSCNQLCVSTTKTVSLGRLSMFHPRGMVPWWESCLFVEEYLPPRRSSSSLLGGTNDQMRRSTKWIRARIRDKSGSVLVFSYRRWVQERRRLEQRIGPETYSAYVETIVSMRLMKLLADGFTVDGFHPIITPDLEFRCREAGQTTSISAVQIGSSIRPDSMPRPITRVSRARVSRDHGQDEDEDGDEDEDEDGDGDDDDEEDDECDDDETCSEQSHSSTEQNDKGATVRESLAAHMGSGL